MNLYLISQEESFDYDTYDSAIVCADNALEAQYMHPDKDYVWSEKEQEWTWEGRPSWGNSTWCKPIFVKVSLIGVALTGTPKGSVLASFNAG